MLIAKQSQINQVESLENKENPNSLMELVVVFSLAFLLIYGLILTVNLFK